MPEQQISWHEEKRPLDSLSGYPRNPRRIDDVALGRLKSQIARVGYHHPIAIQPGGKIISGHQRARALQEMGITEVRVSVPDRELTELSPAYVDVIVRRWQTFTGKEATHAETGETFNSAEAT